MLASLFISALPPPKRFSLRESLRSPPARAHGCARPAGLPPPPFGLWRGFAEALRAKENASLAIRILFVDKELSSPLG